MENMKDAVRLLPWYKEHVMVIQVILPNWSSGVSSGELIKT